MQIERTRKIQLETIPVDALASFAFREFRLPCFPFKWHYHPELELTLVVKGRGLRFVGDSIQDFEDGDICLLGSNTPHTWYSTPAKKRPVHSLVIQFKADFLGREFMNLPESRPMQELFQRARRGLAVTGRTRHAIQAEFTALARERPGSWMFLSRLMSMLGTLAETKSSGCTPLAASHFEGSLQRESGRKLNMVCDFIHANLQALPPQREIAKMARLSPAAFSHFFKRCVGKTYEEYVNELRISRACHALLETDAGITGIAFDAGFNNLSNFNRRFRKLKQMTPREYRNQAHKS